MPAFTVLADRDSVWLVASEDLRYRLHVAEPAWLQAMLARCDGTRPASELIASSGHPDEARDTIERLYEERVLVDGTAAMAHTPVPPSYRVVGDGPLAAALGGSGAGLEVFVQDRFDLRAVLDHNRAALADRRSWMWVTTGPGARAFVGPLFVPDAGPCAECLLVHFKRLSPVPELYDAWLAHAGPIQSPSVPPAAIDTTAALARWKLSLLADRSAAPLYALHVVETADLTVSTHAPLADPECAACR